MRKRISDSMAVSNRKKGISLLNFKYLLFMQFFLELVIFITQNISHVVLYCHLTSYLWMSYFHNIIINYWMAGTTAILLCVPVNEQIKWF